MHQRGQVLHFLRCLTMSTLSYFSGSGPGAQAPDGCSAEVYRHSRYRGEFELFRACFPPGLTVLELGCGSGRLTRALLDFGCHVTAVDNSADMLAELPSEAQPVLCGIEDLALAQRFDVVLLASGLINHADAAVRARMLRVAAQHLRTDGQFIYERQDPYWLATAKPGPMGELDGLRLWLESVERRAPARGEGDREGEGQLISMRLRYESDQAQWHHAFTIQVLEEAALARMLSSASLSTPVWLDGSARRWASSTLLLR